MFYSLMEGRWCMIVINKYPTIQWQFVFHQKKKRANHPCVVPLKMSHLDFPSPIEL
jgi:hypothetical protein